MKSAEPINHRVVTLLIVFAVYSFVVKTACALCRNLPSLRLQAYVDFALPEMTPSRTAVSPVRRFGSAAVYYYIA